MNYPYKCECGEQFERSHALGTAPRTEKCKCGKRAERVFVVNVNIPTPTHPARANRGKG